MQSKGAKRLYINAKDNSDILSRCKLIEGDFFKSIPAVNADGYIIKNVLLNWDDESATVILKNCLQAIRTTSLNDAKRKNAIRLLVIDTIMPESKNRLLGNLQTY